MQGMNATTGKFLTGHDHLKQRIADILTTPLGSRVERRNYGSRLPRMVDQPVTPSFKLDLIQATAEALENWENEFKLTDVSLEFAAPGHVYLDMTGDDLVSGEPVRLEGIRV